jgi:chaperone required for assembly of F1-ATPase
MPERDTEPARPPIDPFALARGDTRRRLPLRFFENACVKEIDGRFFILLDGEQTRTPQRHPLRFESRPLADMVAAEWQQQTQHLDPAKMPITKIVQTGLDCFAADERVAVQAEIVRYAGSDLLCYRAAAPAPLVRAQAEAWNPILDWVKMTIGAHFLLAEGVVFAEQPELALERVRAAVAGFDDCIALAALATITTLSGSALLALAVAHGRLTAPEAWSKAHVDEDFQESQWGIDAEAQDRRARQLVAIEAAAKILALYSR